MIEHTIADSVKAIAKGFKERVRLENVCPATFEGVCADNGWTFELEEEYNGWEVDWWADIITDNGIIHVYGSMYYGTATLTLKYG